jgi:response regulator RpfG family c-di-GMP phosphodiesterase
MAALMTPPEILMVDDEPNILDGYRRVLVGRFTVRMAGSGAEALVLSQEALDLGTPFAIVVSDMMMPGMNGAEFLGRARRIDPEAIQILLSGQADLDSTIAAVNHGKLFRFLTKPCVSADLEIALDAAMDQHHLVQAERELLERTLTGAISVLTELLAIASPEAFARTERVRILMDGAATILGVEDWRLPLAGMLSQIGCIAVPGDVLHRARTGGDLTAQEREVYLAHPQTARRLLERIPRLEEVARWIGDQPVRPPGVDPATYDWQAPTGDSASDDSETLLRAALSFLAALESAGTTGKTLAHLSRGGHYPAAMLEALGEAASALAPQGVRREITVDNVRPGMLLEADVETTSGMILVRRGERVTPALAMRLENFARTVGVTQPIVIMDGV